MQKPNCRYKLFHWNFELLDAEAVKLGGWDYYCYSGYHDEWCDMPAAFRKRLARVVAASCAAAVGYGHKVRFGMDKPEILYSYFELLKTFFGDFQKIDVDTLVDEVINHNQYSIPLDMPMNVCYGSAAIIRYLWEDPRIVYNFITLREKFPEENIGRLFLIGHSQSLMPHGEIHQGHSFVPYGYNRDVWTKKDVDYPSVFKDSKTPGEYGRFVNNFAENIGPWLHGERTYSANNLTEYIEDEADRDDWTLKLLAA